MTFWDCVWTVVLFMLALSAGLALQGRYYQGELKRSRQMRFKVERELLEVKEALQGQPHPLKEIVDWTDADPGRHLQISTSKSPPGPGGEPPVSYWRIELQEHRASVDVKTKGFSVDARLAAEEAMAGMRKAAGS